MADPGDTAALCNDTRCAVPGESSGVDPDLEAGGSVIGEEPRTQEKVPGEEGEEGEGAGGEEGEAAEEPKKPESKVPFVYLIVEPGCTPLSCYSAIITFIIMSCGVFWLLLISPPINVKAFESRQPWIDNLSVNSTDAADVETEPLDGKEGSGVEASGGGGDTGRLITGENGDGRAEYVELPVSSSSSSTSSSGSTAIMPLDQDPTNQT